MSVLGKDLFDFQRSHTNTKVEFGASGYWVEMVPEMQPYGTVLTEILNLDVTPFQKLLDRLNTAVQEKNYDDAPRAYMDMQKGFGSLPLYRLYLMDFRYFGDMKIEEFVGEEVREAFAKYVINEEREIPSFMQQQIKDIQLIQERYAWFLDRVFANAVFEKKKGQRKESLAQLIYSSGYEAFVSGVSLGKDPEVDAPLVRAQYRIRGERENAEVVEKMYFDRLLDFVYVELTKPFSLSVLRARVNTQLRKQASNHKNAPIHIDLFHFDFEAMTFYVEDSKVELSKTEQKLLRLLVENRGRTMTRGDLVDRIWTDGAEYVDENALSVTIKRLRDKLGAQKYIKTVYGIGYSWVIKDE